MAKRYAVGKAVFTNGSTAVTGVGGTDWVTNSREGDEILAPDGKSYEISTTPTVATALTLSSAYTGTTTSNPAVGDTYAIRRYSRAWNSIAALALTLAQRAQEIVGIFGGTTVPSDTIGKDGSYHFRITTGIAEVRIKASGTWGAPFSLIGPAGPIGPGLSTTSSSAITIGTGTKTFTIPGTAGASYLGARMRAAVSSSPSNYLEGAVISTTSNTITLDVLAGDTGGSGAHSSWAIVVTGDKGDKGDIGPIAVGTSISPITIGTGTKTFTTQAGLAFAIGQPIRAAVTASPTVNFMDGICTGYSGTSLSISVPADGVNGSGSSSAWTLALTGTRGVQGIPGDDSTVPGPAGPSYSTTSVSTITIATGDKVFAVPTGLAWLPGARARASMQSNAENYMEGEVKVYTAGSMTIGVDNINGSGASSAWNINLAGDPGIDGTNGASFEHMGDYAPATTYSLRQGVRAPGGTWVYINTTPSAGNAPPTLPTESNAYWQLGARDGYDGTGSVDSVNGYSGAVDLTAIDIDASLTPANYTPSGASLEQHLVGIDGALGGTINPNLLINGAGALNQRGATTATDDTYHVDRWYALTQTAALGVSAHFDAADGVPRMIRLTQSQVTAQRIGSAQIVEGALAKHLRGGPATLSGHLKCSLATTLRYAILGWTGSENAVTSDVVLNWASTSYAPGGFFTSTSTVVIAEGSVAVAANTATPFKISDAVPSNITNLIVVIWSSGTLAQSATLDYTAKLEAGDRATKLIIPDDDASRAKRFYQKLGNGVPLYASTTAAVRAGQAFPVEMRVAPTLTLSTAAPVLIVGAASATGSGSVINTSTIDTTGFRCLFDGFTGLTAMQPGHCQTAGLFVFSAEL